MGDGSLRKIIWVKFAWSEFYRGGPVGGNFRWLKEGDGEGHEAFNFMPAPDGSYYCYVPPHGPASASPWKDEPEGWTVICLAKFPSQKGVHVVGWYEDATLLGEFKPRPEYSSGTGFRNDIQGEKFTYSIKSNKAYFIAPEFRKFPFSHKSVKQAKFSYLSGPGVKITKDKQDLLEILDKELSRLSGVAIFQPSESAVPDESEDKLNPLAGFGTPEHRKKVEIAAEEFATKELQRMGYEVRNRSHERGIGFDLHAISTDCDGDIFVEVKGTSGFDRRFYLTPNELMASHIEHWRLAIVTNALCKPEILFLTGRQMRDHYSVQPLMWIAREVISPDPLTSVSC